MVMASCQNAWQVTHSNGSVSRKHKDISNTVPMSWSLKVLIFHPFFKNRQFMSWWGNHSKTHISEAKSFYNVLCSKQLQPVFHEDNPSMQYLTLKSFMAISDNGNCPVCDVLSPSHLCGSVVLRVDLKMSCVLQIQQGMMGKSEHMVFICHFPPKENILSTTVNLISLQSSILHPHEVLW